MARRSRKKAMRSFQRDTTDITDLNHVKTVLKRYGFAKFHHAYSRDIVEDLRRFDPHFNDKIRRTRYGTRAAIVLDQDAARRFKDPTRAGLRFKNPRITEVCRKRRKRRKILFSSGGIGKGIRTIKKIRRLTEDSKIKC